jgi:hypothetical protein
VGTYRGALDLYALNIGSIGSDVRTFRMWYWYFGREDGA